MIAADAAVAVGVEGVEVDGHSGVAAGIHLGAVEDRLDAAIHDLGCRGAVGVHEEAVLVGFIVTLGIAVTERELQSRLVGNLSIELGDTFSEGGVHSGADGVEGLFIRFRDNEGYGILGIATVNGSRLPHVCIGQADDAGHNFGRIHLVSHNYSSPL